MKRVSLLSTSGLASAGGAWYEARGSRPEPAEEQIEGMVKKRAMRGRAKEAPPRLTHNVYVIELDEEVWSVARFRSRNPGHVSGKPMVYVGSTGLSVEDRFANHLRGYRSNVFVFRYGKRLLPDLYAHLNPMPYEAAVEMERDLAEDLRQQGYAVWQA
jgi:hypothetical protein